MLYSDGCIPALASLFPPLPQHGSIACFFKEKLKIALMLSVLTVRILIRCEQN